MVATTSDRPTAADFLARNRGGGLLTEAVSQRIGAQLSVLAHRAGAPPTALTLLNLLIGAGTSIAVAGLAGAMHAGRVPALAVGLAALVTWHLAYALDCADGQLARVTGASSPAGARVDVLCDVASQILLLVAVSTVAGAYRHAPAALIAAFAGSWMVNLVTSVLQQGGSAASLVSSGSPVVRLVKLVRDYGAMITVLALVIAFVPSWMIWVMVAFTVVNGLFLAASVAAAARASLRAGRG